MVYGDVRICMFVCFTVLTVLSSGVFGDAAKPEHQQQRRGFRFGAADRFSHGFGKRDFGTDPDQDDIIDSDMLEDKRGFRNGAADRFSHGFGKRLSENDDDKRGFRNGAADRFSHGFGKRFMDDAFGDVLEEKRGFRNGAADRFSHGFGKRVLGSPLTDKFVDEASKRGFRKGAADRFSHGFGKRFSELAQIVPEGELLSVDDLVTLVQENRKLAQVIVQRFVDLNGNGFIDKEELFHTQDH